MRTFCNRARGSCAMIAVREVYCTVRCAKGIRGFLGGVVCVFRAVCFVVWTSGPSKEGGSEARR
jgi:hypothetical protein